MKINALKIIALAAFLILFAAAIYLYRPIQNNLTRVTVVGDSQAKVSPDTAVITFSVVTQSKQALDAQQENARKSEEVRKAVDAVASGSNAEVKTSDYSLNPQQDNYSYKTPRILGYDVKNTVTVSIAQLDKVGAVIDAATKAGANSVEGIQFVIGETSPAQGDALALATKQAMAKAESIARSLNGRIVRIVQTSEGSVPLRFESEASAAANASSQMEYKRLDATPVQSGKLSVRSQVVLVVEIAV